jgi:flagellar motor protein MotB
MDPSRHKSVNYRMSVDRAGAVARELTDLGVPSEMIVVTAMADEDPVYYEVMPSGEAGNRRAEIYIDY